MTVAGRPRVYEREHARLARMLRAIVAHYYPPPGLTKDDLMQEARIGLWKACRDYKPGIGTFDGFAGMCVQRQVITAIKAATRGKHGPLNRRMDLDGSASHDAGDELLLRDMLPDHRGSAADEAERRGDVEALVAAVRDKLTEKERAAIVLVANGGGYMQGGVLDKSVDNALQRARVKIRRHLDAA